LHEHTCSIYPTCLYWIYILRVDPLQFFSIMTKMDKARNYVMYINISEMLTSPKCNPHFFNTSLAEGRYGFNPNISVNCSQHNIPDLYSALFMHRNLFKSALTYYCPSYWICFTHDSSEPSLAQSGACRISLVSPLS